jgi:hypothetical protein
VLFASSALVNHLTANPDGSMNSLEYHGLFVMTLGLAVILLKFLIETLYVCYCLSDLCALAFFAFWFDFISFFSSFFSGRCFDQLM